MSIATPVFEVGEGTDEMVLQYTPDVIFELARTIRSAQERLGSMPPELQTTFIGRRVS
jgi:hypothetical protein